MSAVSILQMKRKLAVAGLLTLAAVMALVLLSRKGAVKQAAPGQLVVITQGSSVVLLPQQQHYTVVARWRTSTSNPPASLSVPAKK